MFGFLKKAVKAVGHAVVNAGRAVVSHLKTIAIYAAQAAAVIGVTMLTGGLGTPLILGLVLGGFASGMAGGVVSSLLSGRGFQWKSALRSAALGAALTAVTWGLSNYVLPTVRSATDSVFGSLPAGLGEDVSNAAAGATFGASTQVVTNLVQRRPLGSGVLSAVGGGAFQAGVVAPAKQELAALESEARDTVSVIQALPEAQVPAGVAAKAQGIAAALDLVNDFADGKVTASTIEKIPGVSSVPGASQVLSNPVVETALEGPGAIARQAVSAATSRLPSPIPQILSGQGPDLPLGGR